MTRNTARVRFTSSSCAWSHLTKLVSEQEKYRVFRMEALGISPGISLPPPIDLGSASYVASMPTRAVKTRFSAVDSLAPTWMVRHRRRRPFADFIGTVESISIWPIQ